MQINYNIGFGLWSVVIIIISDFLQNSSLDCTDLLLQQLSWIPVKESWVMWLANIRFLLVLLCVCSFIHSFFHSVFDPKIHSFIYWWLIKLSFIFHLLFHLSQNSVGTFSLTVVVKGLLWLVTNHRAVFCTMWRKWSNQKPEFGLLLRLWKWLINIHKFESWWLYLVTDRHITKLNR